jgi:amino acid adenylation domain-containing protein
VGIHHWLELRAAESPDANAFLSGTDALSYRVLNQRANRLARLLRARGVGTETRVAIALPDSAEFATAALAVLKAGGCYVPLDPQYPAERQQFMLTDSGATVLVTSGEPIAAPVGLVVVDPADAGLGSADSTDLGIEVRADNLAYLIYTSGSTGRPKGVAVSHANVVDLIESDERLAIAPGEVVAHLAPTAFDASVFEIWCTLARGAAVAVLRRDRVSVEELGAQLREYQPDWLFLTTGLFHLLVDHDAAALASVGTLITGGDVLSPQHITAAEKQIGRTVHAAYGPTETTVFASLHPAADVLGRERVPIGTTLANRTMLVLDDELCELPEGQDGEIYLGGAGVARGYHDRPALSAERFLPDPFSDVSGARMYRTGDRGRRLPGGAVEFIGRVDRQVKVRGFRIELGEIEAVLSNHESVGAAAVITVDDGAGGKRLVAYVAPAGGAELMAAQLRAHVTDKLPGYMAPTNYVLLEELPLDPNGKVDRRALPTPWTARADLEMPEFIAPETDVEQLIADVIADVLELDEVGRGDDFFELGGDSLRSVRVLEHLRVRGIGLSARQFFGNTTVAELAVVAGAQP